MGQMALWKQKKKKSGFPFMGDILNINVYLGFAMQPCETGINHEKQHRGEGA